MLKRWISAFMVAALCLTMLPVGVMAEDPVAEALESAVTDSATWPADVPTVAFFSTETPSEETWLGRKDAFKGALEDEATAWLIWDTTKHTADDKADFTMLLDNNDTGETEIVNGIWEDSFDTKLRRLGIELDPNFEQGYVKVSIEYEYSYDLRIALDGVEAWLNIDPDTSATDKDDEAEDDEQDSTVLPTLSYHDEPVRSLDTWLRGKADDILYGNKGTPDVAYLMWDADVVGTVSSVYIDFEDVYSNGFVLGNADMTDTQAINVLSVYDIKLTADWTNHYIQVDTDFNQAYNLYLTLVNSNGERFSCHLNIDEYDITAGDKDEESDLPVVAFYDEKEPSEDSLIKKELLNGPAGETRSAWLIWDPNEFSVDEKADIEVYMEKNEVDGIELPSTAWDDSVDSLLSNYGISMSFVPDKSFVKVTATFAEDQTVDFALTLTDNDSEEHEVQLNIDVEDDTSDSDTVEEDSNPVLMWKYVSSNKGDYYISDNTSFDRFAHDDIHQSKRMAAYLVEDGEETRIPYRKLDVTDNLSLEELDENDKYFFRVRYNDFGLGRIGYGEFDEDLLPEYTDWNLIDEDAFSAVDLMYALSIMPGYVDGNFNPNGDLTRAEVAVLLYRLLSGDVDDEHVELYAGVSAFTDVPDNHWYSGYVGYCANAGILLSEDNTFRPTDTVTYAEAARMLLTAIGYSADARDYTGTGWEDNVLDDADKLGLLDDIPGGYNVNMTRQWVAKLFENALLKVWLVEPGTKKLVTDNTTGDYTLMGKEYFNLEEGNEVYDSVYLSIAAGVSLPFAGFFDSQVYSEDTYAGEVLSYTGSGEGQSQYYIMVPDNWTITDFDTNPDGENDGFDMSFFNWDYVTDADGANTNAILVSLDKDFEGDWYELCIHAASDYGKSADFWFGFEVIDNQPGLRYRYVDQDKNDDYFVEDEFNSEVNGSLDNNFWIAVYYVDGDTATPIPLDDLNIPGITKAELLDEENPYYFRLRMTQLGTDEITCDDYPGSSIPVTVNLPRIAFYSSTERSGETYLGHTLPFTGPNTKVYLLPEDNWTITKVTYDPDNNGYDMSFFDCEIASDGTYAEVILNEGFQDESYDLQVYMERNNGNSTSDRYVWFEVEDARPGLRFKYVNSDENDQFFVEDEFNSEVNGSLDNSNWIAAYYVDGDAMTPIPLNDLNIPGITKAELLDEENPYYFRLRMTQLGTGEITCDDYPNCSIPVTVNLPRIAFYSSPERSGETYLGHALPFTGPNTKVYLLPEDNWTITKLTYDPDNNGYDMSFFDCEIASDGTYAEVILNEGFQDEIYDLRVYMERNNGNSTSDRYVWFEVEDVRPGLKYRYLGWNRDMREYFIDPTESLKSSFDASVNEGSAVAFYFVKDDQEILLSFDDLTFPKTIVEAETLEENDNMIRVGFEEIGLGKISYTHTDGKAYSLPVTITLPAVGWYSEPNASINTHLDEMLLGMYGETKTAYFVWDPDEFEDLEKITVYFKSSDEREPALDDVELEDAEDVLASYNITLTPYEKKGYVKADAKIDIDKNLELTLYFEGGRRESAWLNIDNELNAKFNDWHSDKENPTFTYQGNEYTFGIGWVHDSGKFDMFDAGSGFGCTTDNTQHVFDETVYLGAMMNWNEKNEQTAPAWVHNAISDVSFKIVDHVNFHDLKDQTVSNAYVDKTYTTTYNGYTMETADIKTQPGGFVEALLEVTFTVTMPGEKPVECVVYNIVHFAYGHELTPDMSEIDTAKELNQILSSKNAFLKWIQEQDKENGTNLYDQYMAKNAYSWDVRFALNLPAVVYNDIIEVNLTDVEFDINGTTDETTGKRTTLPGMWVHENDGFFIHGIDFVAVDGITQEYNGETFTCGILSLGESMDSHSGDCFSVSGCNFTGFDYGVRNTPYGYTNVGSGNLFSDCTVGYLIDCAGKTSGNANDTTQHTIFENCKEAIKILGLPKYITSYDYRIYECDFINNSKDIISEMNDRLYCYYNFFGHYTKGAKTLKDVTSLDQIQSQPAGVKEKNHSTIITNPRYAYSIVAWNPGEDNYLTLDGGRDTYIFNSQAGDLLIDAKALEKMIQSSQIPVTINVMDENEKIIGTWTFN